MVITKKHLPRRTFLRGMGVTLALPLLDSMVPAFSATASTAARGPKRLSVMYLPNGIGNMSAWTPATEGAGFELSPIMAPLAPFKDRVVAFSNLDDEPGKPTPGEGIGEHARGCASWLSGVHPRKTAGADVYAGITMDQIAAQHFAEETQLASLELGLDSMEGAGICDGGYSCSYTNAVSWRSPTTPLQAEMNPRVVFERLFGEGGNAAERLARIQEDRSILDAIRERVNGLQRGLGSRDRAKLNQYLDAVRDVERRIRKAEEQNDRELGEVARPSGVPATFEEHIELMFDLQRLAYQADLTRVITFMFGCEISTRSYPEIGVPDAHHGLSHHQNNPEKQAKLVKLHTLHMQMFANHLSKLRDTPDGDGTLFDNTVFLYGACLSDSNAHDHENLPALIVGGSSDQFKGGRHIRCAEHTPMTNLFLTLLDKVGVPIDKMGNSSGRLDPLSV
jgi:hypothetical protein